MSDFKRVINVIPMTRVNLGSSQIFTYLVPLNLQGKLRLGQLVEIPFGRRIVQGVISSVEMHRLAEDVSGLKELSGLLDMTPVLSERSLELANWMANFYITSLGLVVKAMLPKFIKKEKNPELVGYEMHNPDFVLTEHQRAAVTNISNALGRAQTFLLNGITGSGKTEVYMQVIDRLIDSGKQIIILVPEISLTPQAVERFARRFGMDKIALWHSQLKPAEKLWMWRQIRESKKQIIIGPRSVVFAPVQDLGLVIVDEEHDPSYKQFDQNPKYNAKQVAEKLSRVYSCPLLFGDATPSVEFYNRAVNRDVELLVLPDRIKADSGLPVVKLVDMRREIEAGNRSIFSNHLQEQILKNLDESRQIILFLNRRGASTFVMCRDCGYVSNCPDCSSPLVWHEVGSKFLCHHCGRSDKVPSKCPDCKGVRIKSFGVGTQKIETELKKFIDKNFKKKRAIHIERMDKDTTAKRDSHADIYKKWNSGGVDVLVGTQMISKGWDVKNVGLVGVISADSSLYLPDFRSNERTFQLLTQVAGRAGRGDDPGFVVMQTYNPENYSIRAAKFHDYAMFFESEIRFRKELAYPPFSRLVKITISNKIKKSAEAKASEIFHQLLQKRQDMVEIIGPLPAFYEKIRGQWRFQIILRIPNDSKIDLYDYLKDLPSVADIDADPISLL